MLAAGGRGGGASSTRFTTITQQLRNEAVSGRVTSLISKCIIYGEPREVNN